MRVPLRLQVFALLLAAFGLTVVGWGSLQTWLSQNRDRRQIEERLERTLGLLRRDRIPLDDGTASRIRDLSGFELVVRDETGDAVAASSPFLSLEATKGDPRTARLDPPSLDATGSPTLDSAERATIAGRRWFRWRTPLDRRRLGGELLSIDLLFPVATWEAARRESLLTAWGVAGLFVPLGFFAAWFFARRLTSPLSRLRERLDRLAEGRYETATGSTRTDEIGDTLRAADALGKRLQEYESQVRRQERLAAIGEMGAGVAHQMRNALTGALLAIDLHRRACKSATPRADEPLDIARRQLAGMEAYLRRFLDRGQSGLRRSERADLRDVLARVRGTLAPTAEHRQIELTSEPGPVPLEVQGDFVELEQMLLNVATNALEAAGDRISARERNGGDAQAPRVELVGASGAEGPRLIVRDNGPDPARPLDASIFEPLVTSKADGAGLGLTVARRIAEDHGATIAVAREQGTTTFTIRFPAPTDDAGS
ncbi:MAG TPA: HAMP domain-containing sensor histidine kinase [Pirellulaceae bacterium]|jgi:signal transduction histidine kinase|nr:HAMP domain-containing sensor histidine kinase [Pirellulaceae bacterium]